MFVERRGNRDVMTGLALNSYTPVEIVEFIQAKPQWILSYGEFHVRVDEELKEKKHRAMRHGEWLSKKDQEGLRSYEQSYVFDYLYLTGQREKCFDEELVDNLKAEFW